MTQAVLEHPTIAEWTKLTKKNSPRPTDWDSLIGNERAKTQIREAIAASKKDSRPLPHMILFGPAGMGKSSFAKIIARDMGGGYIESTASTLETQTDLLQVLMRLCDLRDETKIPSVLFLDEIHQIAGGKNRQSIDQETLFTVLEDWVFYHNLRNKPVLDAQGRTIHCLYNDFKVWPFTCIGATTDPGLLSAPLLRRFLLQIELEPYSENEIAQIILGAGLRLNLTITPDAAATLAKYSRRNPGTSNGLIEYARARASATDRTIIDNDVALEVIARLNLYELGLNAMDVRILQSLYNRAPRGIGMAELSRSVGISTSQFSMHENYLRALNLMETQARRVIRPEGIRYLAKIGKVDVTRPDVKVALAVT